MWRYILKRLIMMIFVVLGVAILIFTIMYFVPGNPAQIILGSAATPEQVSILEHKMGLDRPYIVQLGIFLRDFFLKGDMGTSYMTKTSVAAEFATRFPRTLILASMCILVSVLLGIPLGIYAATHQGQFGDYAAIVLSMLGLAVPGFWMALMLVKIFSVDLGWLPPFGIGGAKYYVLPILANSLGTISINARAARTDLLEVIRSDYITTARAKGVSEHNVIYKHGLPNALIPLVTMIGTGFGTSLGGTVIIESVFVMPGIGMYMTNGINNLDYPVVRSCVVVLAICFSLIMLAVDLIYAFIDPRIKAQYVGK